jgi:predicted enzyme related to lactoylglutathione lyase
MPIQSIDLAWIVVKDLKSAVKFYTEVVGLKLNELHEQYGWAELSGHDGGARLGIAQKCDNEPLQPGQNAVVTLKVASITQSIAELSQKNVKMIGDILEVPGQVKLQTAIDQDGNHFQLVEVLR